MSSGDFLALRQFAEQLADAARCETIPRFRQSITVSTKTDASPVTVADQSSEAAMRALIAAHRPADGILGEEFAQTQLSAEYVWVLDPIDGTRSFISGSPLYSTLIALVKNGEPLIGVIDLPILNERWVGVCAPSHQGVWFNGEPCQVAAVDSLAAAVMATTTLGLLAEPEEARLRRLIAVVGQTRLGGDAFNYGCLASAYLSLAVDGMMQAYDYLPLVPIVTAAGGVISDWQGAPLGLPKTASATTVVAAASQALHQQALAILA